MKDIRVVILQGISPYIKGITYMNIDEETLQKNSQFMASFKGCLVDWEPKPMDARKYILDPALLSKYHAFICNVEKHPFARIWLRRAYPYLMR